MKPSDGRARFSKRDGNPTPMTDSRSGTSPGWFSNIRPQSTTSLETAGRLIATLPADQSLEGTICNARAIRFRRLRTGTREVDERRLRGCEDLPKMILEANIARPAMSRRSRCCRRLTNSRPPRRLRTATSEREGSAMRYADLWRAMKRYNYESDAWQEFVGASHSAMNRIEVITSVERRRRWSRLEKEGWVAALMEPGANATEVAKQAGIDRSLLYRWRQQLAASHGVFLPLCL